jgi:NADH-quinone oxidoreductase subunit M
MPLVVGVLCFLVGEKEAKALALVASLTTFVFSLGLWVGYDPSGMAFQFVEQVRWIPEFGVQYAVGIDGISLLLILLTTFLTPIIIISATPAVDKSIGAYLGWMLVLEGAMIGTFAAMDTFLFYVFWELMLIPMYFLIGIWGGKNRIYATIKFFLYTMVGSLLMLVAFIWLYRLHLEVQGSYSALLTDYYGLAIPRSAQMWLFGAFGLAFAIKVPMFPLHTWLPDAHVQAPTGGSVILAGVLLKMGTYGFVRFAMPLFPDATVAYLPLLIGLSVIGIVYGALVAMVQDDVKKLVAYSSVSHLGFVMLGLFAFNTLGWTGGIYQMLSHGLSTGALFLLVGVLYERRHTRAISEYGGIASVMPAYSFVFMLVTFSSIGLPGLNGFVGEFLVLLGSFERSPWMTAAAATGVVLGAVYMLWMVQRVLFGPLENEANKDLPDLTRREWTYLAPILVLIVVMGVLPGPFLAVLEPSVDRILELMQSRMEPASLVMLLGEGP